MSDYPYVHIDMSQFKIPPISPAIIEMQRNALRIQRSLYPVDGIVKQTREFMKSFELAYRSPIISIPPFMTTNELLAPIRAQIAENQKLMQNLMHQQAITTAKMLSQIDFRSLATFQNVYEATGVASKHPSETQKQNQETLSTPEFADEFHNEVKTAFELAVEELKARPSDGQTSDSSTQNDIKSEVFKNNSKNQTHSFLNTIGTSGSIFTGTVVSHFKDWSFDVFFNTIWWLVQTNTDVSLNMAIHLIGFVSMHLALM